MWLVVYEELRRGIGIGIGIGIGVVTQGIRRLRMVDQSKYLINMCPSIRRTFMIYMIYSDAIVTNLCGF